MGIMQVTVCDHCGARSEDPYKEHGWIEISSRTGTSFQVSTYHGRSKSGDAKIGFWNSSHTLDMCSTKCLTKFIEGLKSKG
jgi:hypothetical protein